MPKHLLRPPTPMPDQQCTSISTVDSNTLCWNAAPFNASSKHLCRWHHEREGNSASTEIRHANDDDTAGQMISVGGCDGIDDRRHCHCRRRASSSDDCLCHRFWRWRRSSGRRVAQTMKRRTHEVASGRTATRICTLNAGGVGGMPTAMAILLHLVIIVVVVLQYNAPRVEAVRCYCTDEHCVPYGVCEAAVCLVGLLRANNAVIRTCGNEALGCQRNLDRWSHICSCEEHFCNTFLFLRANTNIDGNAGAASTAIGGGGGGRTTGVGGQQQTNQLDERIFERMDTQSGEFATFDHPTDGEERTIKNSNLLTLLLVIVPLSVGAAAVVVVAFNYYCHLC